MRERFQALKKVIRKAPGVGLLIRLRELRRAWILRGRDPEDVFTVIYEENTWNSSSASGLGSELQNVRAIMRQIPALLRELEVDSLLDLPCGDYNWMQRLDLGAVQYVGADIVTALIERNRMLHEGVRFEILDLLKDDLPPADLILCRDCLVHLSFADIELALKNLCRSKVKYLLTTTFTNRSTNQDIVTGQWRALNLTRPPFSFPPPLKVLEEEFEVVDKALALWEVDVLRGHLALTKSEKPSAVQKERP
tara:strand:- start:104 stop:856 length:753 start_codon:yes stop_codon:yes gene_type:complete